MNLLATGNTPVCGWIFEVNQESLLLLNSLHLIRVYLQRRRWARCTQMYPCSRSIFFYSQNWKDFMTIVNRCHRWMNQFIFRLQTRQSSFTLFPLWAMLFQADKIALLHRLLWSFYILLQWIKKYSMATKLTKTYCFYVISVVHTVFND